MDSFGMAFSVNFPVTQVPDYSTHRLQCRHEALEKTINRRWHD